MTKLFLVILFYLITTASSQCKVNEFFSISLNGCLLCHLSCTNGCDGPTDLACLSSFNVYLENGPPVFLLNGNGLYISDLDHPTLFNISFADIIIVTQSFDSSLILLNATTLINGLTQVYNPATSALRISGDASIGDYQKILRSITFSLNLSTPEEEPVLINRRVSISVFDGSYYSDPVYLVVGISDANDNPPRIFISPSPENFVEGNISKKLLDDVIILDNDLGLNISLAQICIESQLTDSIINATIDSYSNIEKLFSGRCLNLLGPSTPDDFRQTLLTIRFENSSEPISEVITVTITIFDGIFSDSLMFNFSTLVVNDNAPRIYADPPVFDLSEGINILRFGLNFTLTDLDDNRVHFIQSLRVTIYPGLLNGERVFGETSLNTISMEILKSSLFFNGSANVAEYDALLKSLTLLFNNTEFSCPHWRIINVQVFDGM